MLIKTEMHIHVHFTLNLGALFGKRLMGPTAKRKAKSKEKKRRPDTVQQNPGKAQMKLRYIRFTN
jgi:hypothetical protein